MEKTKLSSCQGFRARLDDFVDGELTGAELQEAKAHLVDCEACRFEVEETENLIQSARALPLDITPPEEVWPAVNKRLVPQVGWTQAHADREYTKERLAMVAAFLFLAIMPFTGLMPASFSGGWLWGSRGDHKNASDVVTKARTYEMAKQAPSRGLVKISNVTGSLRVVGWDKNVVKVSGKLGKNVQGVNFTVTDSETDIRVRYPKNLDNKGAWITVKVPHYSILRVSTVSANVTIVECQGAIDANTVSGSLVMYKVDGAIKAKSISGDLRISGGSEIVEVDTTSGRIDLHYCNGKVLANTVSGRVDITSEHINELKVKTTSGTINYRGGFLPKGSYNVKSVSGDIHLRLPEGTKANFTTKSMSGMTRTNLLSSNEAGVAHVEARTLSGSITAYKRDWSKWLDRSDNKYADKIRRRLEAIRPKKTITVELGSEVALKLNKVRSAYCPDRKYAEVVRLSENEFLLRGLKVGSTKLRLWQMSGLTTEQPVEVVKPAK